MDDIMLTELLSRYYKGDTASGDKFAYEVNAALGRFCHKYFRSYAVEPDDVMQQTYAKLFGRKLMPKDPAKCLSFIFGIARNTGMDMERHASKMMLETRDMEESGFFEGIADTDSISDPVRKARDHEILREIASALEDEPDELRMTFEKCVIEQKKIREVSAELDVKEGTVKSRVSATKARLRGKLEKKGICYDEGVTEATPFDLRAA